MNDDENKWCRKCGLWRAFCLIFVPVYDIEYYCVALMLLHLKWQVIIGNCLTKVYMDITSKKYLRFFNIRMLSYQYRKSHCGDKTIILWEFLYWYNGTFILNRPQSSWEPCFICISHMAEYEYRHLQLWLLYNETLGSVDSVIICLMWALSHAELVANCLDTP